ncbi:MAG: hypothetical protein A2857_03380 [Candidatus Levybacteria bacterium RIFCSPHIGHO2_01_FULL_36_15]|nr:MAG: hypothetical protein A2857_03380 [Candidatus Levybacteria bacterium RIFCSPHIGHO2_01_FULL_36_15]OGH38639.1 MAG: hypothetical protein A2905_06165 [Candidatus Levybacteria bacterium RIFCSPLOWO2_01_FULL_36_10]
MKHEFDIFGKYWFGQEIDTVITAHEFSRKEYDIFQKKDKKSLREGEKLYIGEPYEWITPDWQPTLGTRNGRIYEILLEHQEKDKEQANSIMHVIINLFNREFHVYDKHPFLSKKYIWELPNAIIIVNKKRGKGLHVISVVTTCFNLHILTPTSAPPRNS